MEEELPLKIIELSDFLRLPSALSKQLEFKNTKTEELLSNERSKDVQRFDEPHFKDDTNMGIVLLKKKILGSDNYSDEQYSKSDELILSKDIIIFADDADRKKIGLLNKSKNCFSRSV